MIYWAFSCLSCSLRSPELSSLLVLVLAWDSEPGKAPGQDVEPCAITIDVVKLSFSFSSPVQCFLKRKISIH